MVTPLFSGHRMNPSKLRPGGSFPTIWPTQYRPVQEEQDRISGFRLCKMFALRRRAKEMARSCPPGLQTAHGARGGGDLTGVYGRRIDATGERLDVAIQGDGFFQVTMPETAPWLIRADGSLKTASDGRITTSDGLPVQKRFPAHPHRHDGGQHFGQR